VARTHYPSRRIMRPLVKKQPIKCLWYKLVEISFSSYFIEICLSLWCHHWAYLHILKTWISLEWKEIFENSKQYLTYLTATWNRMLISWITCTKAICGRVLIDILIDTWLTSRAILGWHSINVSINIQSIVSIWSIVECWLTGMYSSTLDGMSARISQLSTNCWPRCRSSVNQVLSRALINTWPQRCLVYMIQFCHSIHF